MDKENTEKLYSDFPLLYRRELDEMQVLVSTYGCECGNGWAKIIYDASGKLNALVEELPEHLRKECYVFQVKEKLGGLRFYVKCWHYDKERELRQEFVKREREILAKAEVLASRTCEVCGESGKLRDSSYIRTLCDHCEKNRRYERIEYSPRGKF